MNEAQVIVTGNVANKPSLGTTPAGISVANMRLGYTPRRLDRESGQWVDGQTSWVTVKCWRKLADHVAMSLNKGDPVVVKGVLQVRPFTDRDGNPRLGVEVLASAVGHDLSRGVTNFMRTGRKSGVVPLSSTGEPEAGLGSQAGGAGSPAGDGQAAADGQPGSARNESAIPWDASREQTADDADADILDETAVVAAALHAVPDLDAGNAADDDDGGPRSSGSGSGTDAGVTAADGQRVVGNHSDGQPAEGQARAGGPSEGQSGQREPSESPAGESQAGQRRPGEDRAGTAGPSTGQAGQRPPGEDPVTGFEAGEAQPSEELGSDGTGPQSAGEPGRGGSAATGKVPADRNQARFPAYRKAGARSQRRSGATDATKPAKEPSLT